MSLHIHGFRTIIGTIRGDLPFALAVVFCLSVGGLPAADVTVDCSTQSINDVLGSLDKSVSNSVTITGRCTESVEVSGFKRLTLQGTVETGAVIQAPDGGNALSIYNSEDIDIARLTFQGPGTASQSLVNVSLSKNVAFEGCTIQGGAANGLSVDNSKIIHVGWYGAGGVTIQDNQGAGVAFSGGTTGEVGCWGCSTVVRRNGTGVGITNASDAWITDKTTIRENRGDGVNVGTNGMLVVCCAAQISNNGGAGISATNGAQLDAWGDVLLEGNKGAGLNVSSGSRADLWGPTVRGNGDSTQQYPAGGITASGNATVNVGANVINNIGPGIQLFGGSYGMICTNQITGNTRNGILLELNATAGIWCGSNPKNNSPFDVFCAGGSAATSDNKALLGKMFCPGFVQLPGGPEHVLAKKPR